MSKVEEMIEHEKIDAVNAAVAEVEKEKAVLQQQVITKGNTLSSFCINTLNR